MLNLIPQPRHIRLLDSRKSEIRRFDTLWLSMDKEDGRILRVLENNFAPMIIISAYGNCRGCSVVLGYNDSTDFRLPWQTSVRDREEGYYLKVRENMAAIIAESPKGLFYGIHTLLQLMDGGQPVPCADIFDWPDVRMRSMYLDLRQMMPRFENLLRYIGEYAGYKLNTLFIEYEDKISYTKRGSLAHDELAFTEEQLRLIKKTAEDNFIEVIPIVQTFGHLEYVLKKTEYRELREEPGDTSTVCPLHPETPGLLQDLIDETIERHKDARYIHIGCDEVTSLCTCKNCIEKFGGSREKAFLYHVNRLIGYVADKGKIPVIYQDMITKFSDEDLASIDNRAVVMIWLYYGNAIAEKVEVLTARLRSLGIEVMGAPSICCHDRKDDQNYPVVHNRIPNIDQWAQAAVKLDIKCVVITHWAVAGSFGCPYGIYESALYLAYYAAEKLWNVYSDSSSYLERFLHVFHGIREEGAEAIYQGHGAADYYDIIGSLAGYAAKNSDIAEMMDIMKEYEIGAYRVEQVGKYAYRLFSFAGETDGERTALRTKYRAALHYLNSARARMKEKLKVFLPEPLADIYMESRFFLPDYLDKNLYVRILQDD